MPNDYYGAATAWLAVLGLFMLVCWGILCVYGIAAGIRLNRRITRARKARAAAIDRIRSEWTQTR